MPSRVALAIGIGYYDHHPNLEFCPPSAVEVFDLLTRPEYGGCDLEKSKLLTDGQEQRLTAIGLYREVRDILGRLQIGDQFVFYFSGHAELHSDNDLYLTTTESDQPHKGFHFATLVQQLRAYNVTKAILVVDACHSEAMFKSLRNLQSSTVSPGELPKGFGFIAASGMYEKARQIPELKRTLFSYYFCEGIRKGIKTEGDYITIAGLKEYINAKAETEYRQYRQRVHTSSFGEGERELWVTKNLTPKLKTSSDERPVEVVPDQITKKMIFGFFVGLLVVLGFGVLIGRLLDEYSLIGEQRLTVSPSPITEDLEGKASVGVIGALPITETPTNTPMPPTFTPTPTRTSIPPIYTPTPTNTLRPSTSTPTPPRNTPIPTNTPSPPLSTPTSTLTIENSNTTPNELLYSNAPFDFQAARTGDSYIEFFWDWDQELKEDEFFELRIWRKDGEHWGGAPATKDKKTEVWVWTLTRTESFRRDLVGAKCLCGSVAVINTEPYTSLSPESEPVCWDYPYYTGVFKSSCKE